MNSRYCGTCNKFILEEGQHYQINPAAVCMCPRTAPMGHLVDHQKRWDAEHIQLSPQFCNCELCRAVNVKVLEKATEMFKKWKHAAEKQAEAASHPQAPSISSPAKEGGR